MQYRAWRLITAGITGDFGRSPVPQMTHDRHLVCFLARNFERMPYAALRELRLQDDLNQALQRFRSVPRRPSIRESMLPRFVVGVVGSSVESRDSVGSVESFDLHHSVQMFTYLKLKIFTQNFE